MRTLVVLVLLAGGTALADEPWVVEKDNVDISPAVGVEIKELRVDNRLGDVSVIGTDAHGVSISVEKRAPDEATLARLKVNLVPDPSGRVDISTVLLAGTDLSRVPAGSVRIDVTLLVPHKARIDVQAWNGRVSATGLAAGATLTTHEGDITVTDSSGAVITRAVRGSQRLVGLRGLVSAEHGFGPVSLDEIDGDFLAARVHHGSVDARHIRSHAARIMTTFGDIHFRGELWAGGQYELRSREGNVDARVGGSFALDAQTRRGRIESRVSLLRLAPREEGRLRGVYEAGSGALPAGLEMSSVSGVVRVGLVSD